MRAAWACGLLAGAALATAFVLTSRRFEIRYSRTGDPDALFLTSVEPEQNLFVLHEPCETCERRARPGDHLRERHRTHPWIPVTWRTCEIVRDGAVAENHASGAPAYLGVLGALGVGPSLLTLSLAWAMNREA